MSRPVDTTPAPEVMARFTDRSGDCWLWTRYTNQRYGVARVQGRRWLAHRLAWVLANGPIPDGMNVCHRCDQPLCCRPAHLFLGTQRDNLRDMRAKGRDSFTGDRHLLRQHPELRKVGERSHYAKLTLGQVVAIRDRYAQGGRTQQALADEYGVNRDTVGKIVRGDTWSPELLRLTGQGNA